MTPDPNAPVSQSSWWSRNWKWVVPVGCLVPVLCCGTFGAATYFGVSSMITGSSVFTEALAKANQNPEVASTLGTPLVPGFGLSGSIDEKNNGGTANFKVPVNGPKGSGSIHVEASKRKGKWTFQEIEVEAGGKTIDVLGVGAPPPGATPDDEPIPEDEE